MRLAISGIALLCAAAFALPGAAEAQNWQRITSEQDFQNRIVGRQFMREDGSHFTYHRDGRLSGTWSGQPMAGAWQWHQGFLCRNVRVGTNPETGTDCQVWELGGNLLRVTREQGRGTSETFALR